MSAEAPATESPVAEPAPSSPKASKKAASKPKAPKPAKAPKAPRIKKPKIPTNHPTFAVMIHKAISELKDKKGSSRAGILKYILQHFNVGENIVSGRLL